MHQLFFFYISTTLIQILYGFKKIAFLIKESSFILNLCVIFYLLSLHKFIRGLSLTVFEIEFTILGFDIVGLMV